MKTSQSGEQTARCPNREITVLRICLQTWRDPFRPCPIKTAPQLVANATMPGEIERSHLLGLNAVIDSRDRSE
jgi:hypothetical protein